VLVLAIVLEVQRDKDPDKESSWPVHVMIVRDRTAPATATLDERASQALFRLGPLRRRCYRHNVMPARDHDHEHVRRFEDPLGQLLLAKGRAKLLVYSEDMEVICQWTPAPPTAR
jgi:hypothetical protein